MKKKLLVAIIGLFTVCSSIFATTINVQSAQNVALNFLKVNVAPGVFKSSPVATLKYTRTEPDNTIDYYVFDIAPHAFVIVSADDNIVPVIAYSTESYFIPDLNRTGLVNWMNDAATQIHNGIKQQIMADTRIKGLWSDYIQGIKPAEVKSTEVPPLVATTWNQEPYYNALCPFNTHDNERAVTGCVATTMAQIMKYWAYPAQGTSSNTYDDQPPIFSNNYGNQSANFGATTYAWIAMPLAVTSSNTSVATLMYQCAVSVDMDFGDDKQGGSAAIVLAQNIFAGGPCAQNSYVTYFGYNPNTIQGVVQSSYSSDDWYSLMKNEIDAGRPIQYEGTDPSAGGHTWVCDGYDGTGLFHMNWGWGGASDGYYSLSALTAGGFNFSSQEGALIGIEPLYPTQTSAHFSLCYGDTVAVSVNGATNASYNWTPATGLDCSSCASTTAHPTGTTVYTVIIDNAGTADTNTVIVTVYPKVHIASHNETDATCYGAADGKIIVTPSGGTPAGPGDDVGVYGFAWSTGQTDSILTDVTAGIYSLTVTDAVGCQVTFSQVVNEPPQISATTSVTAVSTCTNDNGSASVSASGGSGSSGNFTYLWSDGQTSTTISSLTAGTYLVTVTDGAGCTTVTQVVVPEPYIIQFTTETTEASQGQDNGTASVADVTGGTSPYSFKWSNGDASQNVTNLAPGTYKVTVVDNNGCREDQTVTVPVANPTAINTANDNFSFSIFPNPASSHVTIRVSELNTGTSFRLENILGQTLVTGPVTNNETQLDVSTFPDGVYILEMMQGEKKALKQIVLSR